MHVWWTVNFLSFRAVDPDPHGSAFIFPPGSGTAFNMRIRIQEKKFEGEKQKGKEISRNHNFFFNKYQIWTFEQSFSTPQSS